MTLPSPAGNGISNGLNVKPSSCASTTVLTPSTDRASTDDSATADHRVRHAVMGCPRLSVRCLVLASRVWGGARGGEVTTRQDGAGVEAVWVVVYEPQHAVPKIDAAVDPTTWRWLSRVAELGDRLQSMDWWVVRPRNRSTTRRLLRSTRRHQHYRHRGTPYTPSNGLLATLTDSPALLNDATKNLLPTVPLKSPTPTSSQMPDR